MAIVSRVKKAGAIYPSIGCNVYWSRGPAICPNNKAIPEKNVRESVLGFVRETIARPDLIDRFIKHFEQHYAKLEKTAVTAELNDKIHEAAPGSQPGGRPIEDGLVGERGYEAARRGGAAHGGPGLSRRAREGPPEDYSPRHRGLSTEPAGPPGRRPDPRPDAPR